MYVKYLRHGRWAHNFPLAADFHTRHSNVPSRDHFLGAQTELEAGSLVAVVKHLVVLFQTTFIVNLYTQVLIVNPAFLLCSWTFLRKIKEKHYVLTRRNSHRKVLSSSIFLWEPCKITLTIKTILNIFVFYLLFFIFSFLFNSF